MKSTTDNRVLYLSKTDLSYDYQKKLDTGKKTLSDFPKLTQYDFNSEAKKSIRISDVAIFTFGTDRIVIKTRM